MTFDGIRQDRFQTILASTPIIFRADSRAKHFHQFDAI